MTDTDAATAWLGSASEVRELRRILYAAIDPETGATTAQELRDLIQNELNAIATTPKEVNEPSYDPSAVEVAAGNAPANPAPTTSSTDTGGSLTSFGADDWATVERALEKLAGLDVYRLARNDCRRADDAITRLRAADQAKEEALRQISLIQVAQVDTRYRYRLGNAVSLAAAALAAAAAAPKETT